MQALYDEVGETLSNPRAWFETSNAFFSSDQMRMKETLLRNMKLADVTRLAALQTDAA